MKRRGHLEMCLEKEGTLEFEKEVTSFYIPNRVPTYNKSIMHSNPNITQSRGREDPLTDRGCVGIALVAGAIE